MATVPSQPVQSGHVGVYLMVLGEPGLVTTRRRATVNSVNMMEHHQDLSRAKFGGMGPGRFRSYISEALSMQPERPSTTRVKGTRDMARAMHGSHSDNESPARRRGQAYHPGRCSLMRRVHHGVRVGNFMGFRLSYVLGIMSLCVIRSHSSGLRLGTQRFQAWMMT